MRKQVEQAIRLFADSKLDTEEIKSGQILAAEILRLNRDKSKVKRHLNHIVKTTVREPVAKHG